MYLAPQMKSRLGQGGGGAVNQWSLLFPRLEKDKQGSESAWRRCLWHNPSPIRTQPALSPQLHFRRPSAHRLWPLLPTSYFSPPHLCLLRAWSCAGFWPPGFVGCFSWLHFLSVTMESKAWPSGSVAFGTKP